MRGRGKRERDIWEIGVIARENEKKGEYIKLRLL
jgi:hypothetical protein